VTSYGIRIACLLASAVLVAAFTNSTASDSGALRGGNMLGSARHSENPPGCTADRLRATITGTAGATGHGAAYVVVFNAGETSCSLAGPPTLELLDGTGKVISRSTGRRPFLTDSLARPHALVLDASTGPEDWDSGEGRVAMVIVAQGDCPGGIFPAGSHLRLAVPTVGAINVDAFENTLPFDYRCDEEQGPPSGVPELLIGDLVGNYT
jgi:hypothetical protein